MVRALTVIALGIDAKLPDQFLQLAICGFGTDQTLERMVRDDEFQILAAGRKHPFGISHDLHSLRHRGSTGGGQIAAAFHFDHADAAGSDFVQILDLFQVQIAQGRDIHIQRLGCIEDRCSFRHTDLLSINRQVNHFRLLSSALQRRIYNESCRHRI